MGRVGWILDRTEAPVHVEYCQYYWYWWNTRYGVGYRVLVLVEY